MKALALFLLFASAAFAADVPAPSIEKLDPTLDALVASDVTIEKVGTGYSWSEGPVWFKDRFIFSDVPKNTAYAWKRGDAAPTVFLKPSGTDEPSDLQGSNGLAVDAKANLLLCQHGARRVGQFVGDGKFKPLALEYNGKKFNSPNDLVVAADGAIYFTDPPYGLPSPPTGRSLSSRRKSSGRTASPSAWTRRPFTWRSLMVRTPAWPPVPWMARACATSSSPSP